jgi:hypothetical protein
LNEKVYYSLSIRLCSLFLLIFFLYPVIGTLFNIIKIENTGSKFIFISFFIFLDILIFLLTCEINTGFTFEQDKIIKKRPFLKEKYYLSNDLESWSIMTNNSRQECVFYFENGTRLSIHLSGKRMKESVGHFIDLIYEKIKQKNVNKLNESGKTIKIIKNLSIKINNEGMEIIKKNKNIYYSWNDIKEILTESNKLVYLIEITAKDQSKTTISNRNCQGLIGLTEYLNEKIKPKLI